MKVEIKGNTVIKQYDKEEVQAGIVAEDFKKMKLEGYRDVSGRPLERVVTVNDGYEVVYEKDYLKTCETCRDVDTKCTSKQTIACRNCVDYKYWAPKFE